jgi:hypothetical protein
MGVAPAGKSGTGGVPPRDDTPATVNDMLEARVMVYPAGKDRNTMNRTKQPPMDESRAEEYETKDAESTTNDKWDERARFRLVVKDLVSRYHEAFKELADR